MRTRMIAAAAVLVAGLAGCGPADGLSRSPVQGRITANGQPVNGALVRFVPVGGTKGPGASARTSPDGTFVLEDDRGNRGGVVPGEYRVAVSQYLRPDGSPIPEGKAETDFPDAREQMPRKVTSADASPLTFTVTDAGGEANIDIPESMFLEKGKKIRPEPPRPGGV